MRPLVIPSYDQFLIKPAEEFQTPSFIPYFGCPNTLVTDKGRENINSEIKLLTSTLNIKHIVSTTHHPQSNGLVERRQQMISSLMRKTCEDIASQKNWHLKIPNLQTIINSSVSSSRGFSPFFLTFFRHANFPFQDLHLKKPNYNENSTVAARFNLAQETLQQSQEALGLSFDSAKLQFDKKNRNNLPFNLVTRFLLKQVREIYSVKSLQTDIKVHIKSWSYCLTITSNLFL